MEERKEEEEGMGEVVYIGQGDGIGFLGMIDEEDENC